MSGAMNDHDLAQAAHNASDASPEDAFCIDVQGFEGPLHLLLELARKQKVDLLEVSVLELAEQYLDFILAAQDKRIDLAADYLLMAAWLAFLKSKLLLPRPPKADEAAQDGEPLAKRLAFRLARLDAMRGAVKALNEGDLTGRDVFVRGMPEQSKIIKQNTYDTSLYDLMGAFAGIQNRKSLKRKHVVHRQPVLALENARDELKAISKDLDDWKAIQSLPAPKEEPGETPRKSVVASFFAAALELTRDRAVDLRQDRPMSDVYVRRADEAAQLKAAE